MGGDLERRYTKTHKLIKIIGFILYKRLTQIIQLQLPNWILGQFILHRIGNLLRSKIPILTYVGQKREVSCCDKNPVIVVRLTLMHRGRGDSSCSNLSRTLCCKISTYFKMRESGGEGNLTSFSRNNSTTVTPCSRRTDMQIYRIPSSADSFCRISFCQRTEQTMATVSWVMLNISNIVVK